MSHWNISFPYHYDLKNQCGLKVLDRHPGQEADNLCLQDLRDPQDPHREEKEAHASDRPFHQRQAGEHDRLY
ncbi:hypothetical protein PC116_g33223 [Phytophthora cactorum]|nr:hypothetical protein PC116_g33223 [Phytophthora cactorum]